MLTCTAKGKTFSWTVWLCTCCARMILLPCSVLIPCSLWCDRIVPRLVIRERALRAAMRSGCHCCLSVAVHGERSVQQRTLRKVPAFNSLPVRPRCDLVRRQRSPSHVQHPRHNSLLSRPRPGHTTLTAVVICYSRSGAWLVGWWLSLDSRLRRLMKKGGARRRHRPQRLRFVLEEIGCVQWHMPAEAPVPPPNIGDFSV